MTRYEKIKSMSIDQIAELIIEHNITDEFCKSDCEECKGDGCECLHEIECCVRWLSEEVKDED